MSAQARPRIVIIGGGIGGLFAANALVAHGQQVSLYERFERSVRLGPACS
jgi:salicylate hydroxylase